ncbi:unnamed protein product [Eretmochelys imbricata]
MRRGRAAPLLLPGAGGRAEQRVCAGETFVNSPCPARALLPLESPRAAELQPPGFPISKPYVISQQE